MYKSSNISFSLSWKRWPLPIWRPELSTCWFNFWFTHLYINKLRTANISSSARRHLHCLFRSNFIWSNAVRTWNAFFLDTVTGLWEILLSIVFVKKEHKKFFLPMTLDDRLSYAKDPLLAKDVELAMFGRIQDQQYSN